MNWNDNMRDSAQERDNERERNRTEKRDGTQEYRSQESNRSQDQNLDRSQESQFSNDRAIQSSQLMKLFEDELKDIYWAEKELTNAMPNLIENASNEELIEALEHHLDQTEEQIVRLETVFEIIGKDATAIKCDAMEGLINECEVIIKECENGAMRDEGIISAAQKIEHYEIATYGTLRQFAETLGFNDAVELLEQTLSEEKNADERLTEVAVSILNETEAAY